jgi:hypothetical protein
LNQFSIHLLFSALITEKRLITHKGTKKFSERNRVNVFLTTLESLSSLPVTSAEFFIEFDESTLWGKNSVLKAIKNLPFPTRINTMRLQNFKDWKHASKSLDLEKSDQLMLLSYDDHVFLKNSVDEFMDISKKQIKLKKLLTSYQVMVPLSHFPESHSVIPIAKALNILVQHKNIHLTPVVIPIGAILINPIDFQNWFANDFTKGQKFVAPENPFGPSVYLKNGLYIVPKFEIFRHLDSYSHIGLFKWPYQVLDVTVKVNKGSRDKYTYSPWIKTVKYRKPDYQVNNTILIDSKISGDIEGFVASIIKANCIRISWESINLVNEKYLLSKKEIYIALLISLKASKYFRKALLRTFFEWPILFALKIIFFRFGGWNKISKNRKMLSIILYGAPTGYLRFSRILIKQIVLRRFKLIKIRYKDIF